METFLKSTDAFALFKTALESKAITLLGPGGGANPAQRDAEYLLALLTGLQKEASKK